MSREGSTISLARINIHNHNHLLSPFTHQGLAIKLAAYGFDVLRLSVQEMMLLRVAYIRTLELDETEVGHETDFLDASKTLEVIFDIGLGGI